MISRTATRTGTDVVVERASFSFFHDQLEVTQVEVQHKLRFRFLSVVALALFCDYLLLTLCVPILPAIFGDHYSAIQIGIVFASKPIFQFLANPYMGSLVDVYGPKYPLLAGVIVLAISTFLFAFGLSLKNDLSTAYGVVFVARSVQGIASASTMSAGMTLAALTHHESNRGTAMGVAMLGVALGTLSGPPIGGIMGNFLPLWSPYLIVGALLVVNALTQLYVLHRPDISIPVYVKDENESNSRRQSRSSASMAFSPSTAQSSPSEFHDPPRSTVSNAIKFSERATDVNKVVYRDQSEVQRSVSKSSEHSDRPPRLSNTVDEIVSLFTLLKDIKILLVVVVAVTGNACIGMIEPLIPLYLHNAFNENLLHQGLIFAVATASYLVFTPIAGMLSDVYPKWTCLSVGLAALGFGLSFLFASTGIFRVCVSLFFVGAGMSFIDTPSLPLLSQIIESKDMLESAAGQVYALSDMSLCVGFTVGPILGPLLQESFGGGSGGFRSASLVMGLLCCVVTPLPYFFLHDLPSTAPISAPAAAGGARAEGSVEDAGGVALTPPSSRSNSRNSSFNASPLHHQHHTESASTSNAIRHPIQHL